MAAKKKIAKKSTKKTAKKAATKARASAPKRRKPVAKRVLTPEERQKMLRPRDLDVIDDVLLAWAASPGLKVKDVSVAKLRAMHARATTARERETTLAAKQAEQLRPVSDARLIAEDAVWRAVLEVKATAAFAARHDPALAERFAFLDELFKGTRKPTNGGESEG